MTEIIDRRGAFRVPEAPVEKGRQGAFRLFSWGSRLFHGLYDLGLLRVTLAPLPVISVGALTFGGSAKTPTTRWLARKLLARGWRVAILLRGYKAGQGTACRRVVAGEGEMPGESDEALLLARTCPGAMVFVGADREESCRRAASLGASVCILDDGHQHRRLHATGRLLLWDKFAVEGVQHGGGALREGVLGLERANWVLRCDRGTGMPADPPLRTNGMMVGQARLFPSVQRARLCRFEKGTSKGIATTQRGDIEHVRGREPHPDPTDDVWGIEFLGERSDKVEGVRGTPPSADDQRLASRPGAVLRGADDQRLASPPGVVLPGDEDQRLASPPGAVPRGADDQRLASRPGAVLRGDGEEHLVALSGIARPHGFEEMLRSLGFGVSTSFRYPDHHPFTNSEVEEVFRAARDQGTSAVALTAKDAARFFRVPEKLPAEKRLSEFPLLVFDLEVEVDSEEELLSSIECRIREDLP